MLIDCLIRLLDRVLPWRAYNAGYIAGHKRATLQWIETHPVPGIFTGLGRGIA